MTLRRLRITDFRNIADAALDLRRFNVIGGPNGSGKTSLLEAIYLLGSGRSFRAPRLDPLIRHEARRCVVHGVLAPGAGAPEVPIGVSRDRDGGFEARIQGRSVRNTAELARLLPLQLINAAGFGLLEGGPRLRRQLLDWGVFHVEPAFHATWLDVQRGLRQRNALLRHGKITRTQMDAWNVRLAEGATDLDRMRQRYFEALRPVFHTTLNELATLEGLELSYHRGWDRERPLLEVLQEQLERDQQRGYTLNGPHRADIRLRVHGLDADEMLSRGQQKLVVCALKLAEGRLFAEHHDQECVFLIDDLPAELDRAHRDRLCGLLAALSCQVVATGVEAADVVSCWAGLPPDTLRVFHVEHGRVRLAA